MKIELSKITLIFLAFIFRSILYRYTGDLLTLAHDLADRLLMAFDDETNTGIPHPRVNLQDGVPQDGKKVSCSAGAGSLILEFGKEFDVYVGNW